MDKQLEQQLKIKRQELAADKENIKLIVDAIKAIPETHITIPDFPEIKPTDMTETNKILNDLVSAVKEDITIELVIK